MGAVYEHKKNNKIFNDSMYWVINWKNNIPRVI